MYTMTIKQVIEACKKHRFVLVRTISGSLYGINCKIVDLKSSKESAEKQGLDAQTKYIGFIPCDFQEYISMKMPFLGS